MSRTRAFQRAALPSIPAGRRRRLGLALAAGLAFGLPAVASADVVQAPAASTFRDSVGVEMHSTFTGYAYANDPVSVLALRLKYLGIGHVREFACLDTEANCVAPRTRVGQLASALAPNRLSPGAPGLKFDYGVTPEIHQVPARADRDAYIQRAFDALVSPPLAGTVESIEQNNEPDLEKSTTWAQTVVGDDATIHRLLAMPKYASLAAVPLLTPPLGRPTATPTLVAAGWNASQGEVPNFHPYGPAWGGPENGPQVACATGLVALDCVKTLSTNGGAPIATESGYSTAGYFYTGQSWVSEKAQGIYEPRILLENFALGIKRTYLYELLDLKPDYSSVTNGWGLYRSMYIGGQLRGSVAKPAGNAIHRLQTRIGDLGAAAAPGSLDLSITGADGTAVPSSTVRRVLLRRADGSYALALWQPKSVFDNTMWQQHDLAVADLPITVKLNSSVAGGWSETTFRPSVDASATQSSGSVFTVPVGADVTLIDLRGSGAGTIPGGDVTLR
ncbi:MAG: hypothetical protein AAGC46_09510 [Solirubrobacteraceae bacterium]